MELLSTLVGIDLYGTKLTQCKKNNSGPEELWGRLPVGSPSLRQHACTLQSHSHTTAQHMFSFSYFAAYLKVTVK